jgi:uridine kinase
VTTGGRPFLLGVAGGTGSGKTTVAERLADVMGSPLALVRLDSYYRDRPDLTFEQREAINYDHPDAFDWPLLLQQVDLLCEGTAVDAPRYDFTNYERAGSTVRIEPAPIVVVEGILVLYEPALRARFDLRVYVDSDPDVRFIRRLQRDMADRGRSAESVIGQYLATVRPMHLQFVEPTKRYADVIVPHGGLNEPALEVLIARLRELVP